MSGLALLLVTTAIPSARTQRPTLRTDRPHVAVFVSHIEGPLRWRAIAFPR